MLLFAGRDPVEDRRTIGLTEQKVDIPGHSLLVPAVGEVGERVSSVTANAADALIGGASAMAISTPARPIPMANAMLPARMTC